MTRAFKLNEENECLSFEIQKVSQVRSDFHASNSYQVCFFLNFLMHFLLQLCQKCVRFDKSSRGKIFATGGADGHIRIWNAQIVFRAEVRFISKFIKKYLKYDLQNEDAQPILTIQAHKADVDDIDFSKDSKTIM